MPSSGSFVPSPLSPPPRPKKAVTSGRACEALGLLRRVASSYRWLSQLALLGPLVLFAGRAQAVTVSDLYETSQPVQGSRDAAFVDALKTVLVKVSGQRDAGARLAGEIGDPRQYVQRYSFTGDGSLEVGFDGPSIDKLLSGAGLPIWGRERPATLVLLSVEGADGLARWITADVMAHERDAIARAARDRGLPLKWPALGATGFSPAEIDPGVLLQVAAQYDADAVLLGRSSGGLVHWTLVQQEGAAETSGSLEDGVHLAADTFARIYAVAGSTLDSVVMEISGIAGLDAYADTLNYLEGMTLVRSVAVEQMAGDKLGLRLAVRGDAETLKRAIALDDRLVALEAAPTGEAGGALAFRYQP
jgi:hypothetical protein